MTTALDLALSVSLASYARSESLPEGTVLSVVPTQQLVKVERSKKGRIVRAESTAKPVVESAPKSAPQAAAPSPNGKVAGVALPQAGSIGAKAFIMMMNRAKGRDEKIVAIAAYIGYEIGGDFATQEMKAHAKAKGEIRPVQATGPSREEIKTAQRSAKGYVAGMPDGTRKLVQDLMGRLQLALDTRNELVRESRDHSRPMSARKLAIGKARIEQERMLQIRADLARYVG
jgi:hypothetical protein